MTARRPPPGPLLAWHELLAEPPVNSPHWLSALYGRLRWATQACGRGRAAVRALDERAGPMVDGKIRLGRAWGDDLAPPAWDEAVGPAEVLGTSAPRLVVVGDVRSKDAPLPFYSRSGRWLWEALRSLGWDELGVVVTNARAPVPKGSPKKRTAALEALAAQVDPHAPAWLVLGADAASVVRRLKIGGAVYASHPQAHARFRAKEGPAGYAALLAKAGLRPGPWHGRELPVVVAPGERTPLADAYQVKESIAYQPAERTGRSSKGGVGQARLLEARLLFVTGKAATIKAAAEAVKADYSRLAEVARAERWAEEREEQTRALREAVKAEMVTGEAQRVAHAANLAWRATNLALGTLVAQLEADGAKATANDAARLGGLAVLLSGHAPTTAEQQELAEKMALGPEKLGQELLAWAAALAGAAPEGEGPLENGA